MVFLQPESARKLHKMPTRDTRKTSVLVMILMAGLFFKEGNDFFNFDSAPQRHAEIIVVTRGLIQFIIFLLVGHRPVITALQIEGIGLKELVTYPGPGDQPEFQPVVLAAVESIFLVITIAVILAQDA